MPFRCVRIGDLALGQGPGFHLQVDLCIDVGGVKRNMPEPSPNRVDVHAGTEKVDGGRVANGVGADSFSFQCGHFDLEAKRMVWGLIRLASSAGILTWALRTDRSTNVWMP